MTPDHLGGLSIITWSLSVLIIEGGKPERQRKHGEGSGGGQAGGHRPGAAEASGSYKGRGVPPLELPRDPFGACDLQDRQVINPACFQPLGLRSFGTVAVENEHTLLYLESQLLSGAPHGPLPHHPAETAVSHLPTFLCSALRGWARGPDVVTGARGPSPGSLCQSASWPFGGLWPPSLLAPFTGGLALWVGLPWGCPPRCCVFPGPARPREVASLQGSESQAGTARSLSSPLAFAVEAARPMAGGFSPAFAGLCPPASPACAQLPDTLRRFPLP